MENYERTEMIITEFDEEDVITTSAINPSLDPYEGGFYLEKHGGCFLFMTTPPDLNAIGSVDMVILPFDRIE